MKSRLTGYGLIVASLALGACASQTEVSSPAQMPVETDRPALDTDATVVFASDVVWEDLNPARGEASPRAGTIWGDRNGPVPTAFLARFADGFQSPPHIHNATYRAVVIQGLVHNDDPAAERMWMPPGSFWTQPKGESHITAAQRETIAFVEIDKGPYLVKPVEEAFQTDERPVNVDASNIVWHERATDRVAFLWGDPQGRSPGATFVAFDRGSKTILEAPSTAPFRGVVITGRVAYAPKGAVLDPGSALSTDGAVEVRCEAGTDCTVYVRYGIE